MDNDRRGVPQPQGEVSLQDFISERKAQRKLKAEEKRQLDLQRIRDMKSTSGIDPLEQFPKEIWEKIFSSLNPMDRASVWQVHPLFRQLMEASQVGDIWLPQILQIDTFHRYTAKYDVPLPYLEFNKSLPRVSKVSQEHFHRWIDTRLEERSQQLGAYCDAHYNHVSFIFGSISSQWLLPKLLRAFGERNNNPAKRFLPRGLSVDFRDHNLDLVLPDTHDERIEFLLEQRKIFRDNIAVTLAVIGDQIWHFRLLIPHAEYDSLPFTQLYPIFQQFVSQLPNLKWFEFSIECKSPAYPDSKRREYLDFLRINPFPHVASLERVTLKYNRRHPDPSQNEILAAVLEANPQIKILDVADGEDKEIRGLPIAQIKSLAHLTSFTVTHGNSIGLSLGLIEPHVNFDWPLRSIYLSLNMEATPMNSLFRFLEKFPTLENVKLNQLFKPRIEHSDTWGYLELPNLKDFHLGVGCPEIDYDTNIHFFFSLQFLLRCGKLETLHWILYEFEELQLRANLKKHEKPGETIDFRGGLRVLYDSNIWDVFPSLKSCKVDVRKTAYETDNVDLKVTEFCTHEYLRPVPGQKMSITRFLDSHKCSRNEFGLHNCVVLRGG